LCLCPLRVQYNLFVRHGPEFTRPSLIAIGAHQTGYRLAVPADRYLLALLHGLNQLRQPVFRFSYANLHAIHYSHLMAIYRAEDSDPNPAS
jgi:hypothetical protein